jgi:hypothetical protein
MRQLSLEIHRSIGVTEARSVSGVYYFCIAALSIGEQATPPTYPSYRILLYA